MGDFSIKKNVNDLLPNQIDPRDGFKNNLNQPAFDNFRLIRLVNDLYYAINNGSINANAISNSKLAQMAANTIKGNNTGLTANAIDLTVAQVQTMLGIAPASTYSEVWVTNGNGYGSTNTMIRKFSTAQINIGTGITYTSSATNGDSFNINEQGIYSITYTEYGSLSSGTYGISRNSTQLTTAVNVQTSPVVIAMTSTGGPNSTGNCSATLKLNIGDAIRAHADGNMNSNTLLHGFRICKLIGII